MLALVIGIPIGLQVNRWQQSEIDRALKRRVLSLTIKELQFDLATLEQRHKNTDHGKERDVLLVPLKSDLWRAFVASGDPSSTVNGLLRPATR